MLNVLPFETQTEICKYLPRGDLLSLLRTSLSLYAVAGRILYEHVELKSADQFKAFFYPPPIVCSDIGTLQRYYQIKRAQWDGIKTLDIEVNLVLGRPAGRSSAPPAMTGDLRLDRLRLTYSGPSSAIHAQMVAFLRCLRPSKVAIDVATGGNYGIMEWAADARWSGVTDLTFLRFRHKIEKYLLYKETIRPAFPNVTSATLVIERNNYTPGRFAEDVRLLLRLCPALTVLKVAVFLKPDQLQVEQALQGGMLGKPESFFSIEKLPRGADKWGHVA